MQVTGNTRDRQALSQPLIDLANLERSEMERLFTDRGLEPFRARQVFGWIYRRGVTAADAMTDLPQPLRDQLAAEFVVGTPSIAERERSIDGTEKFRLALGDRREIEAVFIPDTPAMTFCISTQVGCAMACGFCLTGKMGLTRHLTAGRNRRPGARPRRRARPARHRRSTSSSWAWASRCTTTTRP